MNSIHRAVRFRESVDKAIGPNKAFPFVYNFVNKRDDQWTPQAIITDYAANLVGCAPVVLAPGQTGQHIIQLDPDYNFMLLWFKYTVYNIYVEDVETTYIWYEPVAGWFQEQGDYQTSYGTPLTRLISVSVNFRSDSRYLYGGQNLDFATGRGNAALVPLPFHVLQGYDFGMGQVTTPYLLPREGSILFEFTNNHTVKTLRIGGIAYGIKVRL